jgi:hypothetical protein
VNFHDHHHVQLLPVRTRAIRGMDGRAWIVRELPPPSYDRRGAPSLMFDAGDIMRRIRHYPDDWFTLDEKRLYVLSLGV